jgi:hypothetical protein
MSTPTYATPTDVYNASGFAADALKRILEMDDDELEDLINDYLLEAEGYVKEAVDIPSVMAFEVHRGTGEDDEFDLGDDDELFVNSITVTNCIELVKACFFEGRKKKLPFPKDCDTPTDDYSLWDSTGYTQPSDESTIVKAGDVSMKFDWSGGAGTARYPDVSSDEYIDENIDIFSFMFLRLRASVANVTVTIRLYDADGNYNEATFLITKANHWYKAMLDLDEDFTSTINWDDTNLMYLTISVDKACTLYADNLNFNDDWCFTAPSGKLLIMHRSVDEPAPDGFQFMVTYTYDPFKASVPKLINSATKRFAAAKVVEHLIGVRESFVTYESEDLDLIPDKEALYAKKGSLEAAAKADLRKYGYGWSGAPITG